MRVYQQVYTEHQWVAAMNKDVLIDVKLDTPSRPNHGHKSEFD